jgi:hypothetical protein
MAKEESGMSMRATDSPGIAHIDHLDRAQLACTAGYVGALARENCNNIVPENDWQRLSSRLLGALCCEASCHLRLVVRGCACSIALAICLIKER